MYSIYALSDPIDQTIRYIGMSNNVQKRLKEHIRYGYRASNATKEDWLNNLKQHGLTPVVTILETRDDLDQARLREKYWIEQYLHLPLTNARLMSDTGSKPNSRKGTLIHARQSLCINQAKLALMSGVSQVAISRCEHGHPIRLCDAQAILETLDAEIKRRYWRRKNTSSWHINDLNWIIED